MNAQVYTAGGIVQGSATDAASSVVTRDNNGDSDAKRWRSTVAVDTLGIQANIVTKTTAYTATEADHTILCDATSAAFTVTLPAAASYPGQILVIKKIDSSGNAVTIDGNSTETIDGATTASLSAQWQSKVIQSNGTAWYVLAS